MSEWSRPEAKRAVAGRRLVAAALALGTVGALLAVTGGIAFLRAEGARLVRARHAAQGEMRLAILNPAGASLSLHRAGAMLDEAAALPLPGTEAWLGEGRYFVTAVSPALPLLFPVVSDGSGEGPESDGSWSVTVRAPAAEWPPAIEGSPLPFVFVPGGYFMMGDRQNPGQIHPVWVAAFHLAAFEVTNGEFRRFLADPAGWDDRVNWTQAGWDWRSTASSEATARLRPWHPRYRRFGRDDLPVMLVTWHEASAYCRWLTRKTGGGRWLFRMPTEAEWEKAARGPDAFEYGLGMELSAPQSALYNWRKNPDAAVTLVGAQETRRDYRPNRYGVFHASGNAREWTQSVFRRYNQEHPYRDDDRNAPDTPGMRVTRGGAWYSASAVRLRLAYREELQPELSSDDLGFRIAALLGAGQ